MKYRLAAAAIATVAVIGGGIAVNGQENELDAHAAMLAVCEIVFDAGYATGCVDPVTTTTSPPTTAPTTTSPTTTLPPPTTTTTQPPTTANGAGVIDASIPVPADAVVATPATLSGLISSRAAGTNFALQPGTYRLGSLPNKAGNGYYGIPTDHTLVTFDGETVYSGTNPTSGKMRPWTALMDNNTIANLTIKRYRGDDAKGSGALWGGGADNVVIRNVELYENQFAGIRFAGTDWDVSYVTSRHNGQYCFAGSGTGHRLSHFIARECGNAGLPVPRYSEGDRGGSKFVQTTDFTVEYGEVADMDDNGLWFDIGNTNVVIRYLWVHDVEQHGIDVEASFGPALIEHNLVEDSAFEVIGVTYRRACIFFAVTEDVTIRHNEVDGCKNGIMGYQWNHPQWLGTISGVVQATPVRRARIHDNTIRNITHHWAGIASLTALAGCDANNPCADNQFFDNVYIGTPQFYWDDGTRNLAYWTSEGMS